MPKSEPDALEHRGVKLLKLLEMNQEIAEEDRRFAARLCFGNAQLESIRGQHYEALQHFQKTALLLEPIVFTSTPTYDEGVLMYRACANLVGYFIQNENYQRAQDFVTSICRVASRLLEINPNEPEYHRLWANARLRNAIVAAENGHQQQATDDIKESVEIWRQLYTTLSSRQRLIDAKIAVKTAIDFAARWKIESKLPIDEWQAEFDPDKAISDASKQVAIKQQSGPGLVAGEQPR